MKIALKVHKVWDVIEEESAVGEKNDMAIALLFQSIPGVLILKVGEIDTAKKSVGSNQSETCRSRQSERSSRL